MHCTHGSMGGTGDRLQMWVDVLLLDSKAIHSLTTSKCYSVSTQSSLYIHAPKYLQLPAEFS